MDKEQEIFAFLSLQLDTSPESVARRNGYVIRENKLFPSTEAKFGAWEENGKPSVAELMDELLPE